MPWMYFMTPWERGGVHVIIARMMLDINPINLSESPTQSTGYMLEYVIK